MQATKSFPTVNTVNTVSATLFVSVGVLDEIYTERAKKLAKLGVKLYATDKAADGLRTSGVDNVISLSSLRSELERKMDLQNYGLPLLTTTGITEPATDENRLKLATLGKELFGTENGAIIDLIVIDVKPALDRKPGVDAELDEAVNGIAPIMSELVNKAVKNGRLVAMSPDSVDEIIGAIEDGTLSDPEKAKAYFGKLADDSWNTLHVISKAITVALKNVGAWAEKMLETAAA